MPNLPQETVEEFLKAIPDRKIRSQLADIAKGEVVGEVHCLSKDCKKRLIGRIMQSGRIVSVPDEEGKHWLRAHRHRLDNHLGFQCWCGNDSRRSSQELPDIDDRGNPPSADGMARIYERIQKKPTQSLKKPGYREIDGFALKEIK